MTSPSRPTGHDIDSALDAGEYFSCSATRHAPALAPAAAFACSNFSLAS
jgi:hypothetical protein